MYGLLMLVLGGLSLAVGLPFGTLAAGRLSRAHGRHDELYSDQRVPPRMGLCHSHRRSGLLIPLLVSLPTIARASRVTVREALGSIGVSHHLARDVSTGP